MFPELAAERMPQSIGNPDYRYMIGEFTKYFNMRTPIEFLRCAEGYLSRDFEHKTGIKIKKSIVLTCPLDFEGLGLEKGLVSYMNMGLVVNAYHKPVKIAWKAKSGKIYDVTDRDIDCADIEFWFEGLDVECVYKRLYPGAKLPFKLKDPGYELVVKNLGIELEIKLHFKAEYAEHSHAIIEKIIDHIGTFNAKSEAKGRKDGVVHNWGVGLQEPLLVKCQIDMGSAGFKFFKKLLQFFSKLGCCSKVEVS
jgi:hypothetical protein